MENKRPHFMDTEEYEKYKKDLEKNIEKEKRKKFKEKYSLFERFFIEVTPIVYLSLFLYSMCNLFNYNFLSINWFINIIIFIISILGFGGYCDYSEKHINSDE